MILKENNIEIPKEWKCLSIFDKNDNSPAME